MKKFKYTKPTRVDDASFEELFEDLASDDWQLKAERLIKRRERKMRHEMMGGF